MVSNTSTIVKGEEVHDKLLEGSKEAAAAVSTTFGPYGRNVAITMEYNVPKVTKDGATVAGFIKLKDPIKNVAAQLINQAANETAKIAGDGTTSTSILTALLVERAFALIAKGAQPMQIKRDLEEIKDSLLITLKCISKAVKPEDIFNIALVACNGDKGMANMVTEAFNVVGEEGLVTVLDSRSYDTTMDATEGIRLDRTHILPALANGKSNVKHKDCRIAVIDLDIKTTADAIHLLELQEELKAPLLIICNDLTGSAAEVISFNKTTHGMALEVIRAPFIAEARKEAMIDLACVADATLLTKQSGWEVINLEADHCGGCDSMEITQRETNIIGRHGDEAAIEERIKFYENKIKEDKAGLKENYKKRLSFFTSGAAVIYVGGSSETEVGEKKDRFDDTIRAVRSALEEGYVDGGGMAYWTLSKNARVQKETQASVMLADSLADIVDVMLANSGIITAEEHYKSVGKNNIIDPTLVISSTLTNAIGAAIMIFTTECVIIRNEE